MDAWAQPDVRAKLAFVFAMLVIFRFVAHIPIPGVNPDLLKQAFESNTNTGAFLGTLNLFSGGALRQLSVARSASIRSSRRRSSCRSSRR